MLVGALAFSEYLWLLFSSFLITVHPFIILLLHVAFITLDFCNLISSSYSLCAVAAFLDEINL